MNWVRVPFASIWFPTLVVACIDSAGSYLRPPVDLKRDMKKARAEAGVFEDLLMSKSTVSLLRSFVLLVVRRKVNSTHFGSFFRVKFFQHKDMREVKRATVRPPITDRVHDCGGTMISIKIFPSLYIVTLRRSAEVVGRLIFLPVRGRDLRLPVPPVEVFLHMIPWHRAFWFNLPRKATIWIVEFPTHSKNGELIVRRYATKPRSEELIV